MRVAFLGVGLVVCLSVASCGSDRGSGNDVVQSADGRSAVDTLMALITVRAASNDPAVDGSFADHRQTKSIRMSVDGKPWGVFPLMDDPVEGPATVDGWVLHPERSDAVLMASLGDEIGRDEAEGQLDTIAAWVTLLDMHLAPGGHVATIEEIVLEKTDGSTVTLTPRILVPFDVEQGDATAYLGELVVEFEIPGGAQ